MLLQIERLVKNYGGVRALDDVSLSVAEASVVALLGDNGAGKSTLMKCVTGSELPDSGTIRFCGNELALGDPNLSRSAGIEMIYQNLELCPRHDGADNIFLGRELSLTVSGVRTPFLDKPAMERRARELVGQLNADIDVRKSTGLLSGGQQQAIAIARALLLQPKLLIMDEPAAALGPREAAKVIDLIRALKERGIGVILISHRLSDVFEVADRVVLMRHGAVAEDMAISEITLRGLTEKLVSA